MRSSQLSLKPGRRQSAAPRTLEDGGTIGESEQEILECLEGNEGIAVDLVRPFARDAPAISRASLISTDPDIFGVTLVPLRSNLCNPSTRSSPRAHRMAQCPREAILARLGGSRRACSHARPDMLSEALSDPELCWRVGTHSAGRHFSPRCLPSSSLR